MGTGARPRPKSKAMSLNNRQKKFIDEYFLDFNATRAAERAGYKGDFNTLGATGARLIRNDKISEKISQRLRESAMSADEVLSRLAEQARGEHGKYIKPSGVIDIESLVEDGNAHLIKKIKDTAVGREYEFYDAQSALSLLGKHHALFVDRSQKLNIDLTKLTDEQLDRLAKGEDVYAVLASERKGRTRETTPEGSETTEA